MRPIQKYEIREANLSDASEITQVNIRSWQESYAGMIRQSYLDAIDYNERLNLRKRIPGNTQGLHLVATTQDKVIGFCDAGPLRLQQSFYKEAGQLYTLYILKEHQGQGIGKNLFCKAQTWLRENNISPFLVWVLKENTLARRFYESRGGTLIGQDTFTLEEEDYPEVIYRFE